MPSAKASAVRRTRPGTSAISDKNVAAASVRGAIHRRRGCCGSGCSTERVGRSQANGAAPAGPRRWCAAGRLSAFAPEHRCSPVGTCPAAPPARQRRGRPVGAVAVQQVERTEASRKPSRPEELNSEKLAGINIRSSTTAAPTDVGRGRPPASGALFGQQQPAQQVEHESGTAVEGGDHERDPHQGGSMPYRLLIAADTPASWWPDETDRSGPPEVAQRRDAAGWSEGAHAFHYLPAAGAGIGDFPKRPGKPGASLMSGLPGV